LSVFETMHTANALLYFVVVEELAYIDDSEPNENISVSISIIGFQSFRFAHFSLRSRVNYGENGKIKYRLDTIWCRIVTHHSEHDFRFTQNLNDINNNYRTWDSG